MCVLYVCVDIVCNVDLVFDAGKKKNSTCVRWGMTRGVGWGV